MVSFLRAKKANVPTLGPGFLVKFPRVGKAIEVKCPTYARCLPLELNIDRCIMYMSVASPWGRPPCQPWIYVREYMYKEMDENLCLSWVGKKSKDYDVPVKSKLQHPLPPGKPRAFDVFCCPGGRAFDHHS